MTLTDKVDFSDVAWGSVEWTNLCTLYLRAYESRSPAPILGDTAAAEAVDRIDYDWARMRRAMRPGSNQYMVTMRAKQLDDWSANFLRRHPDAVVLHLGCGMDTRALRLNPPNTVRWFDVDQPDVIALRRKLYDDRDGYRMIGSSVTDDWLDEVSTDRPMLMVAEGLVMYLTEPEVRTLLRRLTDRFGSGELLFDTVSPMGPRLSKLFTKGITKWGIRDAREIERWNPRLRLLERSTAGALCERIPSAPLRLLWRLVNATPLRNYDVLNRFAF
ncbi:MULTISPECIES: class I SAM-dependent methyltransferase [unclassified Mycobacterium]|uniref:class I SAM-dependent methyltransferase n=1 Tax=unclassified Mycobacterium TaxID=2642494 RepID=UPI0007FDDA3E|nr:MULTISPECIES: class I SAM-dependent methyltransferase [unclassified Mycobacterium]OBH04271.1 methyltransferase [Mycobacterium sp. E2699]OBI51420.1 methyltransferase [Mycobacterium sp. E787]